MKRNNTTIARNFIIYDTVLALYISLYIKHTLRLLNTIDCYSSFHCNCFYGRFLSSALKKLLISLLTTMEATGAINRNMKLTIT